MNIANGSFSAKDTLEAVNNIGRNLASALAAINHLKNSLMTDGVESVEEEFDPKDPVNKNSDGKFTARGEEICYRLFDAGKTRNAVARIMGISFSAAQHRSDLWEKLGGAQRVKQPLE